MRDPARIPVILAKVQEIWEAHPDMRLGQLLINVARPKDDHLFYLEDDVLLDDLEEWMETSKDWQSR